MTNTTQSTYNLTLTKDQFDVLYDLVYDACGDVISETIPNISDNLDDPLYGVDDINAALNDYEIYKVWRQMGDIKEANKVWIIQTITPRIEVGEM